MTPHESVVFWTQYVLKYNGAKHLRTVGAEMSLYQYLLFDVLALVIFVSIGCLWILLNVTKKMIPFCTTFSGKFLGRKEKIN